MYGRLIRTSSVELSTTQTPLSLASTAGCGNRSPYSFWSSVRGGAESLFRLQRRVVEKIPSNAFRCSHNQHGFEHSNCQLPKEPTVKTALVDDFNQMWWNLLLMNMFTFGVYSTESQLRTLLHVVTTSHSVKSSIYWASAGSPYDSYHRRHYKHTNPLQSLCIA